MHDEAITVLLRQIDLLYYMRASGDRAEMRRVLRALIRSVRGLKRSAECPECDYWGTDHSMPPDVYEAMRERAQARINAERAPQNAEYLRGKMDAIREQADRISPAAIRRLRVRLPD